MSRRIKVTTRAVNLMGLDMARMVMQAIEANPELIQHERERLTSYWSHQAREYEAGAYGDTQQA